MFFALAKRPAQNGDETMATDNKTKPEAEQVPVRYVAVAMHYWGRGMTVDAALQQLKAAGFRKRPGPKNPVRILTLPDGATDAYVDSMGSVCWTGQGQSSWSSIEEAKAAELAAKK